MKDDPKSEKPHPALFPEIEDTIRFRAEEIFIRSGRKPGQDTENWFQAEQEVLTEFAGRKARRTAIVISVKGVQYVGEYEAWASGGYSPGEFGPRDPVPVRFEGNKMFVKRPNGRELETTIVGELDRVF
jgi:Protein of unknown function (DUF2934)